ncbi:MAG: FHA domain-containing protein [Gammaproteobacteria bacterium]
MDILIPVALLLFMLGVGAGMLLLRRGDKPAARPPKSEPDPAPAPPVSPPRPSVEPVRGSAPAAPDVPAAAPSVATADPLAITPKVPMPPAFLEDLSGATPEARLTVPGARTFIGRSRMSGEPGSHSLVVPRPSVGRRHACLYYREGRFFVADLHSRNGTFVNGEPVHEDVPVNTGDEIAFHHYRFRFVVEGLVNAAQVRPEVDEDATEVPMAASSSAAAPRGESKAPREQLPGHPSVDSPNTVEVTDKATESGDKEASLDIGMAEDVAGRTTVDPVVPVDGTVVDPVIPSEGTIVDPVLPSEGTIVDPVIPSRGTTMDPVTPPDGTIVDPVVPSDRTIVDPVIPQSAPEPAPDGDRTMINPGSKKGLDDSEGTILDRGGIPDGTIVDPVQPHEDAATRRESMPKRDEAEKRGDEPTRVLPRGKD